MVVVVKVIGGKSQRTVCIDEKDTSKNKKKKDTEIQYLMYQVT